MWSWLLALLSWAHLQLVEPVVRWWEEVVLGSWEEWLLALIRQGFEEATRFLNALGTWFLSWFHEQSYREQLRRSWQENSWQQWWGQVATRPSTLNALVANLVAQQQQQQQQAQEAEKASRPQFPAKLQGSASAANGVAKPEQTTGEASSSGQPAGSGFAWWQRPRVDRNGVARTFLRGGQLGSLSARLERPVVFVQQSGMGILDELAKRRHGLIEDAKMAVQLAVSGAFDLARSTVRSVLFLPSREPASAVQYGRRDCGEARWRSSGGQGPGRGPYKAHLQRSKSAHVNIAEMAYKPGAGAGAASVSMSRRGLRRSRSYGRLNSGLSAYGHHRTDSPSDALSVIRSAGYPHELHTVTTADGYVLRMERIPRPGARDVVFFMHGVLDTSMAWVSCGVTGSQAFAAWEAGMDVWLGNSRGNAPRQHQDPGCRGRRYWQYNINHMGMFDIAAQLDHIHNVKCAELGAGTVTLDLDHLGPLAGSFFGEAGARRVLTVPTSRAAEGGGGRLLPDRAASTVGTRQRGGEDAGQNGGMGIGPLPFSILPGGARGTARMRQSNSDGNLYRWGSFASAGSSGGGGGGGGGFSPFSIPPPFREGTSEDADEAPAVMTMGRVAGCAGPGRVCEPARDLQPGASPCPSPAPLSPHPMLAPVSCSTQAGYSGGSHGLRTSSVACEPTCGGSEDAEAAAAGGGDCGLQQPEEDDKMEEGLEGQGVERRERQRERPDAVQPFVLAGAAPVVGSSPSVSHKAVTLKLTQQRRGEEGLAGHVDTAAVAAVPGPTTFTLDAKTRTDLRPKPSPNPSPSRARGASPPGRPGVDRLSPHVEAATDGDRRWEGAGGEVMGAGAALGNGASAVTAASAVLDAVGAVLGPAADAVSHAVASAAASAGAALATAAVSATQLLQPSPLRAGSPASAAPGALAVAAGAGHGPFAARPAALLRGAATAESDVEQPGVTAVSATAGSGGDGGGGGAGCAIPPLEKAAAWGGVGGGVWPAHRNLAPGGPSAQRTGTKPMAAMPPAAGRRHDSEPLPPTASTLAAVAPVATTSASAAAKKCVLWGAGEARFTAGEAKSTAITPASCSVSSFRRACSTDHLAGAGVGAADGAGAVLSAAERTGSGLSAWSRTSGSSELLSCGSGGGGGDGPAPETTARGLGGAGRGPAAAGAHRSATAGGGGAGVDLSSCPYKLRCVAHSLGGMSVLIHLVNRLREGRPHHVSRLLLLTPAGFHKYCPRAARPIMWALPLLARALRAVLGRNFTFPLYIPTPLGRALTFKLLLSASRLPGLGELLRLAFKALLDGDISQWDRALQMPHYNAEDMPAISLDQVLHLIQLVSSDAFRLYDYGSPAANALHYGAVKPPDVSSEYWRLDLPVHLVAGRRDGIIPPPNIRRHLDAMRAQGVAVSYREFDFGHLDFTFGVKEELRMYLMKVLRM